MKVEGLIEAEVFLVPVADISIPVSYGMFVLAMARTNRICDWKIVEIMGIKTAVIEFEDERLTCVDERVFNV